MGVLKFESEPHETKGTNNMRMQQQKRERNVNRNKKTGYMGDSIRCVLKKGLDNVHYIDNLEQKTE